MIIYLSGPYSGLTDVNIQAAREIAIELWEKVFTVFTPHLNTARMEIDCKASYEQYIIGDLEILWGCDAVVMLPNWKESRGAKIEKGFAEHYGIKVCCYPDIPQYEVTPLFSRVKDYLE